MGELMIQGKLRKVVAIVEMKETYKILTHFDSFQARNPEWIEKRDGGKTIYLDTTLLEEEHSIVKGYWYTVSSSEKEAIQNLIFLSKKDLKNSDAVNLLSFKKEG